MNTKKFLAEVQDAVDDAEFALMNRVDDLSRQAGLDEQEVTQLLKYYGIDLSEAWRSYTTDPTTERND